MIIAAGVFAAMGQKTDRPTSPLETERSVRAFYDEYADDLRQERRESIANRYDRRGAYLMGNGSKTLQTFEQIKDRYMTKWSAPVSFEWHDLSVEVISRDAAVVMARFEWATAAGKILNFSYTGVLVKQDGKWRIRVEDESTAPPKAAGN